MRKLKLGMVGGGQGAFIGGVHRIAARIDGKWELVAGALSSDPDRAAVSAAELGLVADRSYSSYEEMAVAEAAHDDGIDAVAIVTPNHLHAGPAIAFLNAGINVICDKPLAATPEQANAIREAAAQSNARFFLTHNYTGYSLMRHAREMVANGDLGSIRVIQAEYAQDWLAEDTSNKQANWRHRRYWHSCVQPSVLCVWAENRSIGSRTAQLCRRPPSRRQCPRHAAVEQRRTGDDLGQSGCCRQ